MIGVPNLSAFTYPTWLSVCYELMPIRACQAVIKQKLTNYVMFAFCYSCGSEKCEPLTKCAHCKAQPTTEDQILISLCSTNALTDMDELKKAQSCVLEGKHLKINPKAKQYLREVLREAGLDI